MEHRKVSRFLIGAGAVATAGLAFVFFVYVPILALSYRDGVPEFAHLFWPGLLFLWLIGLLYAAAMVEYFRVCHRIGLDQSFCPDNARGLTHIAYLLLAAGGLWIAGMAFALLQPRIHFEFWCILPIMAAMASAAMGVLAWALGRLLRRAVDIQEENDLTV